MTSRAHQRGAVLAVGLIMLVLVTLALTSAWMLSTTNARATGNLQSRNEAIAAGRVALEQVVSSNFYTTPATQGIDVDLDADGDTDYLVTIDPPVCRSIVPVPNSTAPPSSVFLGGAFANSSSGQYYAEWGLRAEVSDQHGGGTEVVIQEGILTTLNDTQANIACP